MRYAMIVKQESALKGQATNHCSGIGRLAIDRSMLQIHTATAVEEKLCWMPAPSKAGPTGNPAWAVTALLEIKTTFDL